MRLSWFKKKEENEPKEWIRNLDQIAIPEKLGMHYDVSLGDTVRVIGDAINDVLEVKLKGLFFRDHSNVSEHEFNLRLMELKRYFIMCSLLKNVPMFSQEVDEVWHSFILDTREYERFCFDFMGEFLHHSPAISKVSNPGGRAFFDLMYTTLFEFTEFTGLTWGAFFLHPLDQKEIEFLQNSSEEDIQKKYFRAGANKVVVHALISKLKTVIKFAYAKGCSSHKNPFKPVDKLTELQQAPYYAQAMIYFSLVDNDKYLEKMQTVQNGMQMKRTMSSPCGVGEVELNEDEKIISARVVSLE